MMSLSGCRAPDALCTASVIFRLHFSAKATPLVANHCRTQQKNVGTVSWTSYRYCVLCEEMYLRACTGLVGAVELEGGLAVGYLPHPEARYALE